MNKSELAVGMRVAPNQKGLTVFTGDKNEPPTSGTIVTIDEAPYIHVAWDDYTRFGPFGLMLPDELDPLSFGNCGECDHIAPYGDYLCEDCRG